MYSIWFTFEKEDEILLQNIINTLSKKYDSISFKPHVSIYGLTNRKLNEISNICQNISSELKPFNVVFLNISYSNDFWKTVFVNLETNAIMKKVYENFNEKIENGIFEPHISLIYKKMSYKQKKIISNMFQFKKQFNINGISILNYSDKIENWEIVKTFPF
jgi:2'-5' RNA ligase